MTTKIIAALLIIATVSCTSPRTVYVSNTTGKPITLMIAAHAGTGTAPPVVPFKDSLDGKRVERRHLILNFGEGRWTEADRNSLKVILSKTRVRKDGSAESFGLPGNIKIKHYGWFVNELVIRIKEPGD